MNAVTYNVENGIATLTINRAKALNALNEEVFSLLDEYVDKAENDPEVRVAIITGVGEKAFAAGADISEFPKLDEEKGRALSLRGQAVFNKIESSRIPFIAAVNGFALGGGCELAMACHIRIASDNARFGQPEVNLGLLPGYGGTQRLVQIIGKGRALYLLLTAKMLKADAALDCGLVSEIHPLDELGSAAQNLAKLLIAKGPRALALTIQAVQAQFGFGDGMSKEAELFGKAMIHSESKEGVAAFLEKRAPNW